MVIEIIGAVASMGAMVTFPKPWPIIMLVVSALFLVAVVYLGFGDLLPE